MSGYYEQPDGSVQNEFGTVIKKSLAKRLARALLVRVELCPTCGAVVGYCKRCKSDRELIKEANL